MDDFSQEELQKILSLKAEPVPETGSEPRFRRFASLYTKEMSASPECKLTQDEVDRVLSGSGTRSPGA
ncbi:MAG: hypothetical protein LBH26_01590 [Treponema sp.]|nr:hypothetical protein [Treponema sp.]